MTSLGSFRDHAIVACGTLNLELNCLRRNGFLDARTILYTKPGRHEVPTELEEQVVRQIGNARRYAQRIIVVYGGKFCYINGDNPDRTMERIIEEQGPGVTRIKASHCVDMLVSAEETEAISEDRKIYWLTPGWMKYRQ